MNLHGLGVWTAQFDFHPAPTVTAAVSEIEALGYGSVWVGENIGREPFVQAGLLLAATNQIVVATGVANIFARDPLATLATQMTLAEAYPDRFLLGLGVSHARLVNQIRGGTYQHPLAAMAGYLDAMDQARTRYRAVTPDQAPRVLAALGPRMLRLAAERADGAHTYLVPPEHTASARHLIGPDKLLVVEQAVVLEQDPGRARQIGRRHIRRYLPLTNYTDNLRRLGFTTSDFDNDGSDHLVDRLVAWGDTTAITRRLDEHRTVGANHLCVQVLDPDPKGLPLPQWRALAGSRQPTTKQE